LGAWCWYCLGSLPDADRGNSLDHESEAYPEAYPLSCKSLPKACPERGNTPDRSKLFGSHGQRPWV
jgi:hypothetical protein